MQDIISKQNLKDESSGNYIVYDQGLSLKYFGVEIINLKIDIPANTEDYFVQSKIVNLPVPSPSWGRGYLTCKIRGQKIQLPFSFISSIGFGCGFNIDQQDKDVTEVGVICKSSRSISITGFVAVEVSMWTEN